MREIRGWFWEEKKYRSRSLAENVAFVSGADITRVISTINTRAWSVSLEGRIREGLSREEEYRLVSTVAIHERDVADWRWINKYLGRKFAFGFIMIKRTTEDKRVLINRSLILSKKKQNDHSWRI